MGWVLGILAVICLVLAIYLLLLIRLESAAVSRLPLLKNDPAGFTAYWENKYKKMRLRQRKNVALFLVAVGLYRQGLYSEAMERLRFVRKNDPALDQDAVNALWHILLMKLDRGDEFIAFYQEHAASIERGKDSPWMK